MEILHILQYIAIYGSPFPKPAFHNHKAEKVYIFDCKLRNSIACAALPS